jgi:hypothetical protein
MVIKTLDKQIKWHLIELWDMLLKEVCSKDTTLPLIIHESKSKYVNYEFEKLQDS